MVSEWYMLFLFTIVFFGITWYLSLNPSKLVDWFGKFLTPLLVLIVAVIVGKAIIDPIESQSAVIATKKMLSLVDLFKDI